MMWINLLVFVGGPDTDVCEDSEESFQNWLGVWTDGDCDWVDE